MYKWLIALEIVWSIGAFGQNTTKSTENIIVVDFTKKGTRTIPLSFGISLEEINHALDGGLYAELIRNRAFEEKSIVPGCTIEKGFLVPMQKSNYLSGKISNWKIPWDTLDKWPGWHLRLKKLSDATLKLTTSNPFNAASPHSMQIDIAQANVKSPVYLVNDGYWGISVVKGQSYNLRFFLRTGSKYKGKVTAQLITERGKVLGSEDIQVKSDSLWNEYNVKFTAQKSDEQACFALCFSSAGKVWVDYVSLISVQTFKNRPNGVRNDVVQLLAGLKPSFIRWPGGCAVEGLMLDNRIRWKETLGDPSSRPGTFGLWGYRNSYGLGFHEFLQLCEDIGTSALFVCNAGLSCINRSGDSCADTEVPFYIQDVLDAIEYALGDSSTTWGAKRIAAGHKEPFPLKYIEVGNENYGIVFSDRFSRFYNAIKAKYPQVDVIAPQESLYTRFIAKTDFIDLHFFHNPQWFYSHSNIFDNYFSNCRCKIYIGGFAANQGSDICNWNGALSEAAFMTGLERNAGKVSLLSYAPVISNVNDRTWPGNMVWVNSERGGGSSSYYVQKLFSENTTTQNLFTSLELSGSDLPKAVFKGLTGLGTSSSNAIFKDFSITQVENNYQSDYYNRQEDWEPYYGHWRVENGEYIQGDLGTRRISILHDRIVSNASIEVKARKVKGNDGFTILFGVTDKDQYYQLSVGANGNKSMVIEKVMGGIGMAVSDSVPFTVASNRWYNIKVTIHNDEAECFIDGKLLLKYKIKEPVKRYAVAGFDEVSNEIVLKVVNAEPLPLKMKVILNGAGDIMAKGTVITLSSSSVKEDNSIKRPTKIIPHLEGLKIFSDNFNYEFKPNSFTIFRIKRK